MVKRYELTKPDVGSFKSSTNAEDNAWGDVVFYNDVKHMIKFYEERHSPSNDPTTATMRKSFFSPIVTDAVDAIKYLWSRYKK